MNFQNFSIQYFSIHIFTAMYAVNVTSPAQLPLVSGCRNSGESVDVRSVRKSWDRRGFPWTGRVAP